ncbi:fibrinogen-like protein 1 [Anopheles aquasalis]|uniref:fibrinogen-like protein 1 n=1 Tax=Anopheles aquasalis TaxID=42839 RepID=UPI00215B03B9|nr:fibrinogen-like protein 1 [Anopheles aquasalis]
MDRIVWFIVVWFLATAVVVSSDRNMVHPKSPASINESGFSLELLLTNNDILHHMLRELREDVLEQRKIIAENQVQLNNTFQLLAKMQQEANDRHAEDAAKMANLQLELQKQREEIVKNRVESSKRTSELGTKLDGDHQQIRKTLLDIQLDSYWSCKDVPTKVSGTYKIRMKENLDPFQAYCAQVSMGGGWMEIQYRSKGELDFNRNWMDYRKGFGEVNEEHWIGLEKIYQFTKEHNCELIVWMKDFHGNDKYAHYDAFAIGSEAEGYYLKTLGSHSGTAGDSLRQHEGSKFSTADRDNDASDSNCAKIYEGGWWYKNCYNALLNGLYRNVTGKNENKIEWYGFNNDWRGLSYTRMQLRPLD